MFANIKSHTTSSEIRLNKVLSGSAYICSKSIFEKPSSAAVKCKVNVNVPCSKLTRCIFYLGKSLMSDQHLSEYYTVFDILCGNARINLYETKWYVLF